MLSTHQTEDVAALCATGGGAASRGGCWFAGTPAGLAERRQGRVWTAATRRAGARLAWRNGDGMIRHVGDPPGGAELAPPTLEDGYLLLVGDAHLAVAS